MFVDKGGGEEVNDDWFEAVQVCSAYATALFTFMHASTSSTTIVPIPQPPTSAAF